MKRIIVASIFAVSSSAVALDCGKHWEFYQGAGKQFNVDPYLIKAHCINEANEMPGAVNDKNSNGTIDIGACQINSFWFERFAGYGITEYELKNSVKTSIYAAGYVIAHNFEIGGRNSNSIGAYNAGWRKKVQHIRDEYSDKILNTRAKLVEKCM